MNKIKNWWKKFKSDYVEWRDAEFTGTSKTDHSKDVINQFKRVGGSILWTGRYDD